MTAPEQMALDLEDRRAAPGPTRVLELRRAVVLRLSRGALVRWRCRCGRAQGQEFERLELACDFARAVETSTGLAPCCRAVALDHPIQTRLCC